MQTLKSKRVNFTYPEDGLTKDNYIYMEKVALKEVIAYPEIYVDAITGETKTTPLSEYLQNKHGCDEANADEIAFVICEYWEQYVKPLNQDA